MTADFLKCHSLQGSVPPPYMRQRLRLLLTVLPPGCQLAWPAPAAAPLAGMIKIEWIGCDKSRWLNLCTSGPPVPIRTDSYSIFFVCVWRRTVVSDCVALLYDQWGCRCDSKAVNICQKVQSEFVYFFLVYILLKILSLFHLWEV